MNRSSRTIYSNEVLVEAANSPWWWSLAKNPPCEQWCMVHHHEQEFMVEGILTCGIAFDTAAGRVEVNRSQVADEDQFFRVTRGAPTVSLYSLTEDMSSIAAAALAAGIARASVFCQGLES